MANRITQAYNQILLSAPVIESFYRKDYLHEDVVDAANSEPYLISDVDMYYRISSYEVHEEHSGQVDRLSDIATSILGYTGAAGSPLIMTLVIENGSIKVFYGTNHNQAGQVRQILAGNLLSPKLSNEWIGASDLTQLQHYNGFVSGLSKLNAGTLDQVLNSLRKCSCLINFILIPISQTAVKAELASINQRIEALQSVSTFEHSIGSIRNRKFERENQSIQDCLKILTLEKMRLQKGALGGLWLATAHISSGNPHDFRKASSILLAAFRDNTDLESSSVLAQFFPVRFQAVKMPHWFVPVGFLGRTDLGGLYRNSLLTVADLDLAASLALLPMQAHPKYPIRVLGGITKSGGAFDQFPQSSPKQRQFLSLGKTDNENILEIELDSLRQHTFVTGATRYGKSTTVQKLIRFAHANDVPFLVIEAAKKEYWKLLFEESMKSVNVYSIGMDAKDFRMNPFQPELNTLLDFHVQSLIQAFLSLFDQSDPLPQILSELCYLVYEKKGWQMNSRVRANENRPYPILSDMLLYLDECVESIGYSNEVSSNMKGVIRVRLNALLKQAGNALDTQANISVKELFETSAIIELEEFPERSKAFVAALLAIKVNEYSKQCDMKNQLRRLLVIEEAHHIIPNTEMRSVSANAAESSKYFSNMLAEVSAFGTGLIIVDQRPSVISSAALANSGLKIVHNLREGSDIETISKSLSLNDIEADILNKLEIGQAIIVTPQLGSMYRVRIAHTVSTKERNNLTVLYLDDGPEILKYLTDFETEYIRTHPFTVNTLNFCLRQILNRQLNPLTKEEITAIAGELATYSNENDLIKRQELYAFLKTL